MPIDRLGQAQAVEHFGSLRGSGCSIEASPTVLHGRHRDLLEDLAEDAIGARCILFQEMVEVLQVRQDLRGTNLPYVIVTFQKTGAVNLRIPWTFFRKAVGMSHSPHGT